MNPGLPWAILSTSFITVAFVVLLGLLVTSSCGKKPKKELPMPDFTVPVTEPVKEVKLKPEKAEQEDASMQALRQAMVGTNAKFAVAYFGYIDMAGTWELAWTEFEGYQEEAEPGSNIIEIAIDQADSLWISFSDYAHPDAYYADKELVISPYEMYYGCGNDQWTATVNHTGQYGTEYSVTLLDLFRGKGGLILAPGGALGPNTPSENIHALAGKLTHMHSFARNEVEQYALDQPGAGTEL